MEQRITDIHCPSCGAPARFDIVQQRYACAYCGGRVSISEAQQQMQGYRKMRAEKLRDSVGDFPLSSASCSGCGATVVFEDHEALSHCAFCGRSLLRSEYLDTEGLPECVIPFVLTEDEARDRLRDWCEKNAKKAEAQKLREMLPELRSFYLPYELVQGPVHMKVSRMAGGGTFRCEGVLKDAFVNRSAQLDNLLLDGMEPFDIDRLTAFDFAYVAGCRVKISDVADQELEQRTGEEAGVSYTPAVRKTLQTKAMDVQTDVAGTVRLPVLLPVCFIAKDGVMAAVNGQTGKVSVRAEKESHYYFLPWWLKAILITLLSCAVLFAAVLALTPGPRDRALQNALYVTAAAGICVVIPMLCLYSDTTHNRFAVEAGREIFTSEGKPFRRDHGKLVPGDDLLTRQTEEPVYFATLDGRDQPVRLSFLTPGRVLRIMGMLFVALFLPAILALFFNGFDFQRLDLGGSVVWFCIMVPVAPIYLMKFGLMELYEHPRMYIRTDGGSWKLYKKEKGKNAGFDKTYLSILLRALFVPPGCIATWFVILCFVMIVYLTAGFG